MSKAHTSCSGYYAWAWSLKGSDSTNLEMTTNFEATNASELTDWGRYVLTESPFSTKKTGVKASIFGAGGLVPEIPNPPVAPIPSRNPTVASVPTTKVTRTPKPVKPAPTTSVKATSTPKTAVKRPVRNTPTVRPRNTRRPTPVIPVRNS